MIIITVRKIHYSNDNSIRRPTDIRPRPVIITFITSKPNHPTIKEQRTKQIQLMKNSVGRPVEKKQKKQTRTLSGRNNFFHVKQIVGVY